MLLAKAMYSSFLACCCRIERQQGKGAAPCGHVTVGSRWDVRRKSEKRPGYTEAGGDEARKGGREGEGIIFDSTRSGSRWDTRQHAEPDGTRWKANEGEGNGGKAGGSHSTAYIISGEPALRVCSQTFPRRRPVRSPEIRSLFGLDILWDRRAVRRYGIDHPDGCCFSCARGYNYTKWREKPPTIDDIINKPAVVLTHLVNEQPAIAIRRTYKVRLEAQRFICQQRVEAFSRGKLTQLTNIMSVSM